MAKLRRSNTRLRSNELQPSSRLRRDKSARFFSPSYRVEAFEEDRSSPQSACGGQGIQAKANKSLVEKNKK